jgi:hypothetical protein
MLCPDSAGAQAERGGPHETYILDFTPTQNAPPDASGTMRITVRPHLGDTIVRFSVRRAYPDTLYTIWTVFGVLKWPLPHKGSAVPMDSPARRPGFPPDGNAVSPLARLDDRFTGGMGFDPGATFVTDANGDGALTLKLDYDLIREAPVSNRDLVKQCVPTSLDGTEGCLRTVSVTTTWLRTFIGQFPPGDRASSCANYDPAADPDVADATTLGGLDARLWQCVDPASVDPPTGRFLVRVPRFEFDHFRLAAHPDGLTHGFIGGNSTDHRIDMVGLRRDLTRVRPNPSGE